MEEIIKPIKENEFYEFGYTEENFSGYLTSENGILYISLIESLKPKQGNFKKLIESIRKLNKFDVIVIPTPSNEMKDAATKLDFEFVTGTTMGFDFMGWMTPEYRKFLER